MDAFAQIAENLAGFGFTLDARTRLAFGTDVAKALAGIVTGGTVVVLTQGATDNDAANVNDAINTHGTDKIALVDARTHGYSQVRPHVASFLKSRKIAASVTPPRKDADGNAVGFLVRK